MSEVEGDGQPARLSLLAKIKAALGLGAPSLRDDIEDALDQGQGASSFTPQERTILRNVLELHAIRVEDVMVPRADMVALAADAPLSQALTLFRKAGHSRLPVHGDSIDDPRGMVHIRDFLDYLASVADSSRTQKEKDGEKDGADSPVKNLQKRAPRLAALGAIDLSVSLESTGLVRPVLFVPPSMPALDLLVKMQASHIHIAIVIDEHGGTDGLVSMEDVVEAIVGDIEDEHDFGERPRIEPAGAGEFVIDARADLESVSAVIGFDLAREADSEDVDTLAGLTSLIAGRVPERGEIVKGRRLPLTFEVLDADKRRVKRLLLRIETEVSTPPANAP